MNIDTEKIRELADLALEKNLAEIIVQDGDKSVTIKLPQAASVAAGGLPPNVIYTPPPQPVHQIPAQTSAQEAVAATPAAKADDESRYQKVTSPMVGTFYAAPSPDSPAFVSVGSTVAKGQTICIIEAMKLMNELESDFSGKVVKILVDNGQPVEFGQGLMLIDPAG